MEGISFGRPIITMNEVITLAKKNWKVYAFWVLFCEVVGAASGFLSMSGMEIYTATAAKPPLTPPPWVFPVVWTILFALMGISAARISLTAESKEQTRALNLFFVQLVFNFFWPLFFFNLQAYGFALLWLVLLWVAVLLVIVQFYRIDTTAAWLLIPYLIWLTFAAYLNAGVVLLN